MRQWPWVAFGLSLVSLSCWLLSFSWIIGVTPPTRWLSEGSSPWWVAEIAAVGFGGCALILGGLLSEHVPLGHVAWLLPQYFSAAR